MHRKKTPVDHKMKWFCEFAPVSQVVVSSVQRRFAWIPCCPSLCSSQRCTTGIVLRGSFHHDTLSL